jgi:hypothetical protein
MHHFMLNLSNRSHFHTLLDAVTLQSNDDERPAIIYLETDRAPLTISRREFREAVLAHAVRMIWSSSRTRRIWRVSSLSGARCGAGRFRRCSPR